MFFKTGILKICSTFTAEIYQGAILIKLRSNFIEILLRHGCFPVDLLHISRIPFSKKTRGGLLLKSIERDMWFPKWHLLEIKEKKPSLFDCASSVNKIKNRKIKLLVLKKSTVISRTTSALLMQALADKLFDCVWPFCGDGA